MHRERPEVDPDSDPSEDRLGEKRRKALDVLLDARERLLNELCDDVLGSSDALAEGSPDGALGFEFQEIEDRYGARLHALNSILENLEYRRPRIVHRVETLRTTVDRVKQDLAKLLERFDQWDLVDIDMTRVSGDDLLVLVGFTADEYVD